VFAFRRFMQHYSSRLTCHQAVNPKKSGSIGSPSVQVVVTTLSLLSDSVVTIFDYPATFKIAHTGCLHQIRSLLLCYTPIDLPWFCFALVHIAYPWNVTFATILRKP
jgi:hypothetical protein